MLWLVKQIKLRRLDTFSRPIFFMTNIEMCNVNIQTLKRVISILFTSPVEMVVTTTMENMETAPRCSRRVSRYFRSADFHIIWGKKKNNTIILV